MLARPFSNGNFKKNLLQKSCFKYSPEHLLFLKPAAMVERGVEPSACTIPSMSSDGKKGFSFLATMRSTWSSVSRRLNRRRPAALESFASLPASSIVLPCATFPAQEEDPPALARSTPFAVLTMIASCRRNLG